jgi:hypothetical protein
MRSPIVVAILLLATRVQAFDITSCNAIIPEGQTGTLQADLVCAGPDLVETGVTMGPRSVLELNGHGISNAEYCVGIEARPGRRSFGRAEIRGPGEIHGCEVAGIVATRGTLVIDQVFVHDHLGTGIFGPLTRVLATGVTSSQNGSYGFDVERLVATQVTANLNGPSGIKARIRGENVTTNQNGGNGVTCGPYARLRGLTSNGNGVTGISGIAMLLRDSTLLGNGAVDIASVSKPRVRNTTCGLSANYKGGDWNVCAND